MKFLSENLKSIPTHRLYTYEEPNSKMATKVVAAYMLIQGFYGNTMQDREFDICKLPVRLSLSSYFIFSNSHGIDRNTGTHHQTMDLDPSRTSNFYISTDWLDLSFLERRWCCYRQTLGRSYRSESLCGSLGLFRGCRRG